jgi:hypothetical protein
VRTSWTCTSWRVPHGRVPYRRASHECVPPTPQLSHGDVVGVVWVGGESRWSRVKSQSRDLLAGRERILSQPFRDLPTTAEAIELRFLRALLWEKYL